MDSIATILYIIGLVILIALCCFSSESSFKKGIRFVTLIYAFPLVLTLHFVINEVFCPTKRK